MAGALGREHPSFPILGQAEAGATYRRARELEAALRAALLPGSGAEGEAAEGPGSRNARGAGALPQPPRAEVRFDAGSRALYSTDASNYRQLPVGVVIPGCEEDLVRALEVCRRWDAPVLMRGAGTSLAGQTCNAAVVLDCSKFLNRLLWLDAERKLAAVEPGLVLDRLRDAAERHGLTFAPDPATHSRCTLGGMIGNNSCGVHGLLGGKVVDNVRELDVLLYDGTRMTARALTAGQQAAAIARGGREGQIVARLAALIGKYAPLVRERFPAIPRRVSGYNLDWLLPENGFHLARALVGSEGTCATVLAATLELTDSPPFRALVGLAFPDAFVAADHVPAALEHRPIGLEGFDGMLVDFMRRKRLATEDVALLPPGGGYLLAELGASSAEEAGGAARRLLEAASRWPVPPTARLFSPAEAARVWHVREQALAATVFVPGEPHGWEGWEDSAVPPARLGAYLRSLFALLDRYGYRTPMYGHFGQGCVHMRINFDFGSAAGIARFRSFLDEAAEVVLAHGGSLSGEHGDGQARAALLPRMFGAELMEAFGEFKRIWDPDNRMNPGKLVDLERVYEPTENLRLGRGEEREPARLALAGDGGSLARAVSRCVGVGACRKTDRGTMCPSYMATREEAHSTRGRARLLWEMLEGSLAGEGWRSEAVRESLDLCLACKACKSECPVNVDMAGYKAEFLSHYYEGRLHPPRHYLFGHMDRLAHLGSLAPRLGNGVLSLPGAAGALRALLGIAPERALPRLAARSFQSQRRRRAPGAAPPAPAVVLWPDTWNNYYYPQALAAAARLLEAAGLGVRVPRGHVCCGRPLYDFGFLDEARTYLERVLRRFAGEIGAGMPFVFLEPSCASVFRDELLELFPDSEPARRLAAQTRLLADVLEDRNLPLRLEGEHLVHGHCHHRAVFDLRSEARVLAAAGASVRVLDAGCCGMAGPFGFEARNYQVSMAVGERGLLPEVRRATPGTVIVSDGFSCREQVRHGSGREAVHFAEALARGL